MPDAENTARSSRIPRREPAAMMQDLGGEAVVLHTGTEQYFTLNEVGVTIWELIDGHRDVPGIVAGVLAEYDAEEATVTADVMDLLDDLARHQLITWSDGANE